MPIGKRVVRRVDNAKPLTWSQSTLEQHVVSSTPCPTSLPSEHPITLVCVSDTHNTEPEVPAGDVLLHSGDLTYYGKFDELQKQLDWIASLPHTHKVVIGGNHDLVLDEACDEMDEMLAEKQPASELRAKLNWHDIIYLEKSSVTLDFPSGRSLKIYGSPYTPEHGRGSFQYDPAEDVWSNTIPEGTEVLMTHGPPKGYHDAAVGGHAGCPHLLREIWRVKPRLVLFGHIHSARGMSAINYNEPTRTRDRARMGEHPSVGETLHAVAASKLGGHKAPDALIVNASTMGPGRPWYDPKDRYTVLQI